MMKFFSLISFFILLSFQLYAQSKKIIYVNENYDIIDFHEFNRKLKSDLFFIAHVENDTAMYKKLRFKVFFGKLNSQKKSQLNKLLYMRNRIDSTKIWLIHYIDSLPNPELMPKKSGIVILDSLGHEKGAVLTRKEFENSIVKNTNNSIKVKATVKHKHVLSYEDYTTRILSEIKTYNKFDNSILLHFYNFNNGFPVNTDELICLKDYNLSLRKTFTDGMRVYKKIIIYPDGDFCLGSFGNNYMDEKRLLKYRSFKKVEKKWNKKRKQYN